MKTAEQYKFGWNGDAFSAMASVRVTLELPNHVAK